MTTPLFQQKFTRRAILSAFGGMAVLSACGGNSFDPTAFTLSYTTPSSWKTGVGISALIPTLRNVPTTEGTTYDLAAGSLSMGLRLGRDGVIGGTPTLPGVFHCTITAFNGTKTATTYLTTTVEDAHTLTLAYALPSLVAGTATVPVLPILGHATPGLFANYQVSAGALPAGLALNPSTGAITGTPTTATSTTFSITATNGQRSAKADLLAIVSVAGTFLVSCPQALVFPLGSAIAPQALSLANASAGTATTFQLASGSLPPGLSLNVNTGSLTGTPIDTGPFAFSVTASNGARSSSTNVSITITPALLSYTNHWVANSGGRSGDVPAGMTPEQFKGNAGNFFTDFVVVDGNWYFQQPGPYVMTLTDYDETGLFNRGTDIPDGSSGATRFINAGAVYKGGTQGGARVGKGFWIKNEYNEPFDSRRSTSKAGPSLGIKAVIENFYGRAFFLKLDPPPVYPAAGAPYVSLSNGKKITSVVDPTAVDFDLTGKLWIADNGPDQNFKIFDVSGSAPTLVGTFGETGGVFAGPVPGKTGDLRFWGPRAIAHDASGNIYAGCTGMSMQMMGGTDIRCFAPDRTTLLWKVMGTFTNTADALPGSDGQTIYLNSKNYQMDYTQPPGKSWKHTAVTLDPFTYPDDARLSWSMEIPFVRKINGITYMYLTNMYVGFIYVVRFMPGSEVGIPTAFICNTWQGLDNDFWKGLHPTWTPYPTVDANKCRRWMWRDDSGNGQVEAGEFHEFQLGGPIEVGLDVDENGNIFIGGEYSHVNNLGGILYIPFGQADAHGVPAFATKDMKYFDVPYPEFSSASCRLKYIAATDTMYFMATYSEFCTLALYRYDHYTDPAKRSRAWALDLGANDLGVPHPDLDRNTAGMVLPTGFTADTDYVYIMYVDNGPDAKVRGEISVLSAKDGHKLGWIVPSDSTGHYSGATDLKYPINVTTRANGDKILMAEENGAGKVMVYRWTPPK